MTAERTASPTSDTRCPREMRDVWLLADVTEASSMLGWLLDRMMHSNLLEMKLVACTVRGATRARSTTSGRGPSTVFKGTNSLIRSTKEAATGLRNVGRFIA
jgi:hypothetical protein